MRLKLWHKEVCNKKGTRKSSVCVCLFHLHVKAFRFGFFVFFGFLWFFFFFFEKYDMTCFSLQYWGLFESRAHIC